jgi:hypothetical protein
LLTTNYSFMAIPKKYFHDRMVLLLFSANVSLVILGIMLILLKIDPGRSDGYIVQYRANLGISAYQAGGITAILSFIGFLLIVLVLHTSLSMRVYHLRRYISVAILGLGALLLVLSLVVSNALLLLR